MFSFHRLNHLRRRIKYYYILVEHEATHTWLGTRSPRLIFCQRLFNVNTCIRLNRKGKSIANFALKYNMYLLTKREAVRIFSRAVRLFPAPLAQMRTTLIRDFNQWLCKGQKGSQGRTGHMIICNMTCTEGCLS